MQGNIQKDSEPTSSGVCRYSDLYQRCLHFFVSCFNTEKIKIVIYQLLSLRHKIYLELVVFFVFLGVHFLFIQSVSFICFWVFLDREVNCIVVKSTADNKTLPTKYPIRTPTHDRHSGRLSWRSHLYYNGLGVKSHPNIRGEGSEVSSVARNTGTVVFTCIISQSRYHVNLQPTSCAYVADWTLLTCQHSNQLNQ